VYHLWASGPPVAKDDFLRDAIGGWRASMQAQKTLACANIKAVAILYR
jgi:hypothetical protein